MTWVKIDDSAMSHPKLLRAGPEAVCLWLGGLCYANRHATAGAIPFVALPGLYPAVAANANELAERLIEAGLWEASNDGYVIHDYVDFQSAALKENVEARRASDRERKARQREKEHRTHVQLSRRDAGTGSVSVSSSSLSASDLPEDSSIADSGYRPPPPRLVEPPPPDTPSPDYELEAYARAEFTKRWQKARATCSDPNQGHLGKLGTALVKLALVDAAKAPKEFITGALDGFFQDPYAYRGRYAPCLMAADPGRYGPNAAPPPVAANGEVTRDHYAAKAAQIGAERRAVVAKIIGLKKIDPDGPEMYDLEKKRAELEQRYAYNHARAQPAPGGR